MNQYDAEQFAPAMSVLPLDVGFDLRSTPDVVEIDITAPDVVACRYLAAGGRVAVVRGTRAAIGETLVAAGYPPVVVERFGGTRRIRVDRDGRYRVLIPGGLPVEFYPSLVAAAAAVAADRR